MSIAFPGYVPDVHSSDALDPAWGNAIRDRASQVFDTTVNRDAAITVPQVGQSGVITTGSNAGEYFYVGATDGWRAAWNSGWGVVGSVSSSALSQAVVSTTGIDVSGLSVTFTAVANRLYRVTAFLPLVQQSSSAATSKVQLTDASNNILTTIVDLSLAASGTGSRGGGTGTYLAGGISAGSYTVKLRALTGAGTMTLTTTAAGSDPGVGLLIVEDIGPAGSPS